MLVKTCPKCLGDTTVDGLCIMCGYGLPADARTPDPAWIQNVGSMTTAQRDWPYPSRQLRPGRLVRTT